MTAKARSGGGRLSLQACRIGLPHDASAGWLVLYASHLLAILSQSPDGRIVLAVGFKPPFEEVEIDWPDLASARADFAAVARLYRADVVPAMIQLDFDANG